MGKVYRDDTPPQPGPKMELIRIKPGPLRNFTILAEKIRGFWTHWIGDESGPCFDPREECPHCQKKLSRRWKGYLHVLDHDNRVQGFLEFTPRAADMMQHYLPKECSLRGIRITMHRTGAKSNGRLNVTVQPDVAHRQELPPEKDVYETTLKELWKRKEAPSRLPHTPLQKESGTRSDTAPSNGRLAASV